MANPRPEPRRFVEAITRSGKTIYDPIEIGDPELWIPSPELQALLDAGLRGVSLAGLALRTRSRVIKEHVCRVLGYPIPKSFKRTKPRFPGQFFDTYASYQDDGQFPDIRHQLVEIKLQTSPTIDLGLVCPNSMEPLDVPQIQKKQIRHCDVRYAIFYGRTDGLEVTLTHLMLSTGEDFFKRFPQFGGKVLNKKLQIPLPRDFFGV